MKKALSLMLAIVLCLSLCACGNDPKDTKAVVTNLKGATESLSANELIALSFENQAKFDSLYDYADVTIVGTVESVRKTFDLGPKINKEEGYYITLEEGWVIGVLADDHEEVINFSKGDKITVTSKIQYCSNEHVYMFYIQGQIEDNSLDLTKIESE